MATSNNSNLPAPRDAINEAAFQAHSAALAAAGDNSLGGAKGAIAEAWQAVYQALVGTTTPTPEDPGSQAAFDHRMPLIQEMSDEVSAAVQAARRGASSDVVTRLTMQIADLQRRLEDQHPVKPAIQVSTEAARAQFDLQTQAMQERLDQGAGAAVGKARSAGKRDGVA